MARASLKQDLTGAKLHVRAVPYAGHGTEWVPGQRCGTREPPQAPPPPVSFPDRSKPICLPYFDEELVPGTSLWVTGWGYTQEHGEWDMRCA